MTSAIFREMEQIGRETRYGAVGAGKVESMTTKPGWKVLAFVLLVATCGISGALMAAAFYSDHSTWFSILAAANIVLAVSAGMLLGWSTRS